MFTLYKQEIYPVLISTILIAVSCASNKAIYDRKELTSLELRPRPNHTGLTSLRCLKWEGAHCVTPDILEFDLNNDSERLRLHDAKFVCRVGAGPVYRICKELHGLCQQTSVTTGSWFNRKTEIKLVSFLDINEKYQYLLDKGTYCFSLDSSFEY